MPLAVSFPSTDLSVLKMAAGGSVAVQQNTEFAVHLDSAQINTNFAVQLHPAHMSTKLTANTNSAPDR